ncbi:MAG: SdrD B-like domain-containing protein [Caldilineaceae bacterium]
MRQTRIIAIFLRLTVVLAFVLADTPAFQLNQAAYAQDTTSSTPDAPSQQTVYLPLVATDSTVENQAANVAASDTTAGATDAHSIYLPLVSAEVIADSQTVATDDQAYKKPPKDDKQPTPVASALPSVPINKAVIHASPVNPTNTLTLRVESARDWAPSGLKGPDPVTGAGATRIPKYHWLIVQDDTGDPTHYGTTLGATDVKNSDYACKPQSLGGDPAYPANCQWPAIHSVKGGTSAEVVAQGDETTLNETTGIDTTNWPQNDHNPNRSYMISVMAEGFDIPGCTVTPTNTCHVDGFKIDGQWFSLPLESPGLVTVAAQPYPLPLTTVRMAVWNDIQTNGAYDTGEPNLAGFEGHIDDVLGPVTTDWYGNPICTKYQHDVNGLMIFGTDGKPLIQTVGGHCFSDANGVITIPYLGPDRYASTVTPPNGQHWFQTSTLEGWHDWDTWSIEGWNGYDPEFVQGAEPFPFAEFGFVQIQTKSGLDANSTTCCNYNSPAAAGSIKGTVVGIGEYAPQVGGVNFGGQGKYIIENINQPLISLIDTGRDDTTVYVGRGNADGAFQITNVPDGDYVLSFWDEDQAYLLTQATVSIVNGQALDMGVLDVAAWHSQVYGKVCNDTNRNGKCDTGEPGIPGLLLNLLDRDNKVAFYGDNTATTDNSGNYRFPRTYPLGQWVVTQGYWEQFYTVGVTYQTENQPSETTVMANGGFVDVSSFNLIGHQTRMDWAVHPYETPANASLGPTNGGIVGEIVATTTRNELEARFQAIESYEPGLPDATVHLYAPVKCAPADPSTIPAGTNCTLETTNFGSSYYLTDAVDGSLKRLSDGLDKVSGNPIDLFAPYTSETWQRPTDCVARGAGGTPVVEQVLPPSTGGHDCLEAPLMASQVGNNSVGPFMQVNGNYGFTQIDHDPTTGASIAAQTLPPGDYLVQVDPPKDANGRPAYEVVKEEDINIFSGDEFVAPGETAFPVPTPNRTPPTSVTPAIPPFPCAGVMHTVNVTDTLSDANFSVLDPANTKGVYNPDMVDGGGSPYEGRKMPLCDVRLVTVRNGRSATPNFHFKPFSGFKPDGTVLPASAGVPLPGRIFGIAVDDLNLSTNPKELFYGEKYGIPNLPIGIYDFSNRLVKTIQTDPQGQYEVILPSTSSYNCPLPAGPCPGIYRFLANDPGQPGHLNPGYNPAYRTIGGFFEVWPGVSLPSDLAPTPVAFGIENPGTQQAHPAACLLNDPAQPTAPKVPELFAVNKPYARANDTVANRSITAVGQYFGTIPGTVTLDGTQIPNGSVTWSEQQIVFVVPPNVAPGPHQLVVTASNGQHTVNGLTFHVLGGNGPNAYNPTVIEVGPGKAFDPNAPNRNTNGYEHALQDALDNAAGTPGNKLVVVYPGPTSTFNPFGSYFENVIIHSPVKLQGVGPGGIYTDPGVPANILNTYQPGSVLDGLGYGTDGARDTGWQATLAAIPTVWGPNNAALDPATVAPPEGEVVLVVATSGNQYTTGYKAAIDGLTIQNGDVMDFVPNVNTLGNGTQVGGGNNTPTNPNQGGALVALASTKYLQVTNNIIRSNAGAYGAIRFGTPLVGDNNLDGAHIANNRILNNGGSNLAGAVGIFNGTYGYEVNNNDLCGNFSAEYGGAISHFGLTGNLAANGSRNASGAPSSIHDNRIYFNGSYDEGGGVIIAGEPPVNPTTFGAGAGPVNIYNNLIEANLANDDGGGLRFLTAGNFPYNVYNNMIVNNISTHEGGGVAIDNAPNVRFYNNTVMKNLTTATAATSNGQPAPAGLSTATNSAFLQPTLPAGSPTFSNPLMFNNIFWDNRAGTWDPAAGLVRGIGGADLAGNPDLTPLNHWDMGVPGTAFQLSPTNSVLQTETTNHNDVVASPTNRVDQDPLVNAQFNTTINALPWRGNPNFIANVIVAQDVPVTIMGDYHLSGTGSSAYNAGAANKAAPAYQQPPANIAAPTFDIDNQGRPALGGFDSGADEFPGLIANLSITKDDGVTTVQPGGAVQYTIVVGNAGPDGVAQAVVVDNVPAALTNVTWTCTAPGGSLCNTANGSGNINATVNLPAGGSATFVLNGTVAADATGNLVNTATIAAPAGTTDPNGANNSATDTDAIVRPVELAITKTDGATLVSRGSQVRYTIVVSNNGPNAVTGATVTDNFPTGILGVLSGTINWTCATTGGATCGGGATGSGNINRTVNLPVGGTITFATTSGSVSATTLATSLANTASVTAPAGFVDTNPANNSATDTDTINGLHVGDLNWTSANASATQWSASVVITVHDVNHNPVSGATVTGGWPLTNSGTCTTNASGQCTLTRTGLSRSGTASVTFAVLNITHTPDGYQITLNHDPDTGAQASNGTTITASRP